MSTKTPELDAPITGSRRRWRAIECLAVFFAAPLALYPLRYVFSGIVISTLVVLAVVCTVALVRDRGFDRRSFGWGTTERRHVMRVLARFLLLAPPVSIFTAYAFPELLFAFPSSQPAMWLIVMLGYPLLSVFPQETLFRAFFFRRYEGLFGNATTVILVSDVSFALAHVFFDNWIAPTMSLVGGYFFATTYARSRSTLLASLEHALWGDFVFTIGLGWYFYTGSIG